MKKIILDCSWNPGEYNLVCTWDENKAHCEVKKFNIAGEDSRTFDVEGDKFKQFVEAIDEIDLLTLDREYLPADGMILEDAMLFNFLYDEGNKFCSSTWQIGTESEEILALEDAIMILDPKFEDLFPIIQ